MVYALFDLLLSFSSYDKLALLITQLEQQRQHGVPIDEDCLLFVAALDNEVDKVTAFYSQMERTLHSKLDFVLQQQMSDDSTERQMVTLYTSLVDLEAYVELNRTGLTKVVTLYNHRLDKELNTNPLISGTALSSHIDRLKRTYAQWYCHGSIPLATRHLSHAPQPVMVMKEKHVSGSLASTTNKRSPPATTSSLTIPCWGHRVISIPTLNLRQYICFLLAVLLFIALLSIDCFGNRQENYCFALLVFAAILWATEAIPLYATSLALPFLIVLLGVMRTDTGQPMSASAASKMVFGSMFSSTIMMLLGGFALAAALGKYGIARAFATHVLSRAGTRPRWVLLAIMLVAGFLSMWISNVATPVLCFSLIEPILRTLSDGDDGDDGSMEKPRLSSRSPSSSPSAVGSCLVLGIALASCIGGMTSPISSPQNIITVQYMNPMPGWGVWFMVALPISILSIFVCWFLLLLVYRPDRVSPHLNKIQSSGSNKITRTQVAVMIITLITIGLWCAETTLASYLGSTGIVATLPLFLFFGTGILDKEDLNGFLWSVVLLAQGGMALGEAVTSSGLLQDIALRIKDVVAHLDVMVILAIFSVLVLVFATFVSHTVAALIIIPIVQQVGQQLPVPHPNLLVMGAGLACSAGMGLPVSGYPNMSAIMLEDPISGRPYLTTRDFVVTGVLTSIFCCLLVITMGYGIMYSLGY